MSDKNQQKKNKVKKESLESINVEAISQRINNFIRANSYVLTVGIILTFFVLNMRLSSLADEVERTLVKNTEYIKRNLSTPIFLSATGQVLTVKKSPMGFEDERFKSYLSNLISDVFITGLIKLSSNYSIPFTKAEDIITKNKRFHEFFTNYAEPEASKELIDALYWSVLEGRLPEYVDLIGSKIVKYKITQVDQGDLPAIEGRIIFTAVAKSWIVDMSKWDTRTINISIDFSLTVDVFKYANTLNPFGVHFTSISMPIPNKPSGRFIVNEKNR